MRLVALAAFLGGCAPPPLDYLEVKRIDEPVSPAEYQAFVRIVASLPGKRVPALPPLFPPPPDWSPERTLPVSDLVAEESALMDDRWSVDGLAEPLFKHRPLQRALARERMSTEQFVGLVLTLGAALSRNSLRGDQDLKKLLNKGDLETERLEADDRGFASLSEDARYSVLQRAAWITRRARVERLLLVPIDNVDLVREHRDFLLKSLPVEFCRNPLDDLLDWLDERGVPFEEVVGGVSDVDLEWSRETALIGNDPPDPIPSRGSD